MKTITRKQDKPNAHSPTWNGLYKLPHAWQGLVCYLTTVVQCTFKACVYNVVIVTPAKP